MPRAEPLNEKIVQALQSRKRRAEQLNQQKQHQYGRAIQLITSYRGNITRISQLTGLCKPGKITKPIFDEIEDVISGSADVDVAQPSPAAQARAQARGPAEQRLPALGSGAAAILLVLYRESLKPTGAKYMTKDQLQDRATRELHVNMYDESGGYSRWSGIKTLEDKEWVKREAWSRRVGGGGSGRFGGRKDEFWITEQGKAAAAKLETQLSRPGGLQAVAGLPGRTATAGIPGGGHYRSPAGPAYRAAAAGFEGDSDSEQDPFASLLAGILTGPEFAEPQRLIATGHASSPFTGGRHVLGQGVGRNSNGGRHAAAASGGVTGVNAQENPDEDLEYVDADGFQLYIPELFEDKTQPRAQHTQPAQQHSQLRPPSAQAPAAAASVGGRSSAGPSTAALQGLLPKVRKCDKREPLCAPGSGCAPCKLLQEFLQDARATRLPMIISKKQQQHVLQRVAYLAAAEGGNMPVAATVGADKTLTVEKQLGSAADGGTSAAASATAGKLDPLTELAKLLGSKTAVQHPQQRATKQMIAAPRQVAAAATSGSPAASAAPVQHRQQEHRLTPAQMAAAAAEARARQHEQQVHQHTVQHKQREHNMPAQQQQQPIILDSQLDELGDAFADHRSAEQRPMSPGGISRSADGLIGPWQRGVAGVQSSARSPPAAAATHKRRRTQPDLPGCSTPAVLLTTMQPGGSVDMLQESQEQYAAVLDALQPGGVSHVGKRQRRQLVPPGQQQQTSECINLLESQDADLFAAEANDARARSASASRHWQQPRQDAAAVPRCGVRQTMSHVQHTMACPGNGSSAIELRLIVDDKERRTDRAPNQVYQYIRQDCARILQSGLPAHITVDVDRDESPLGDYAWLVQQAQQHRNSRAAAAAAGVDGGGNADGGGDAEEEFAAEERSRCVVAGAVVERKVIRDIVGRTAGGDHIRQLQRMYQFREAIPYQLLIIENLTQLAQNYTVYSTKGSSNSHTAIYDEATLFDFIVRVAVSSYGSIQKILLAPSTGDTRCILLALYQLLIYELQHGQQQFVQQRPQHDGHHEAAGQLTYAELKQQVNEVNRRLPRWDVPAELAHSGAADVKPPDVAFRITTGQGQFEGLKLYSHKTYQGSNHLHVLYIGGRKLLVLLDSFFKQSRAEAVRESVAQLSVAQAVEVALEMGVLLASVLDAFVAEAAAAATGLASADAAGSDSGDGSSVGCRILLIENLVGPTGALTYMQKAQQAAAISNSRPATKKAADRQDEMCQLDGPAVSQHLWLWLVCFALRQGWHVQLCQSANSVGLFLQTAGSRCCFFAQQLRQSGLTGSRWQVHEEQTPADLQQAQQQSPLDLVIADSEGEDDEGVCSLAAAVGDIGPAGPVVTASSVPDAAAVDAPTAHKEASKANDSFAAWLERVDPVDDTSVVAAARRCEVIPGSQPAGAIDCTPSDDVIVID